MAAKLACSGVFVGGRDLAEVAARDITPLSPLAHGASYRLDRAAGTVTAEVAGVQAVALHRPGVGATLVVDTDVSDLRRQVAALAPPRRVRQGRRLTVAPARDPGALDRAVAAAFAEPTGGPVKDTRALVVLHEGRLVAERYAPGFGPQTRLLGWSASKSVLGALVGALVDDGRLDLAAPVLAPEWRQADDPRRAITHEHLLTMSSGLGFDETYAPGSDCTAMLFERGDMAAYAASRELVAAPGTAWAYSSGATNLLARAAMRAAGGDLAACQAYARGRLFEPVGMASAVFEPDVTGVMVGSSYLHATARDWARFGQLHLDDGMADGHRVLSSAWIRRVRTPAPAAPLRDYGGHFRLNGLQAEGSTERAFPSLPVDMFFARGFGLQVIAVFPAQQVVIVRMGWTLEDEAFDMDREFAAILAGVAGGVENPS